MTTVSTTSKPLMHTEAVRDHFNEVAEQYDFWMQKNRYYHEEIKRFFASVIPAGERVLEVGCGTGEVLAHVSPAFGLGVDVSEAMIQRARDAHPHLEFRVADAGAMRHDEKFDHVIMADVVDHLPDVWQVLQGLEAAVHPGTRLVLTTINPLWDPILMLGEKLGLKMPEGPHNFLPKADIINLLQLHDYRIDDQGFLLLLPKFIPGISGPVNAVARRTRGLRNLCCVQYVVATKESSSPRAEGSRSLTCSVVIPCHNEEDNVAECVRRTPKMGAGTEILFVDDGSTDATRERVEELCRVHANVRLVAHLPNRGKGYSVRQGFLQATGDVMMILDADMTVPPEDLPKFFLPLAQGRADFVNGSRMVYPMENEAMRTLNLFGNKVFSVLFTWLLGQRVTDTLCGTKALLRKDFPRIHMEADPWGDFDLLFSASQIGLKIVEMPVRYRRRVAGDSKMRAFKHGWMLLKMCWRGFKELKWQSWRGRRPDHPTAP